MRSGGRHGRVQRTKMNDLATLERTNELYHVCGVGGLGARASSVAGSHIDFVHGLEQRDVEVSKAWNDRGGSYPSLGRAVSVSMCGGSRGVGVHTAEEWARATVR